MVSSLVYSYLLDYNYYYMHAASNKDILVSQSVIIAPYMVTDGLHT